MDIGDNMIYILTGIAKSGKSLVSKRIKEVYDVSFISTDKIMIQLHETKEVKDLDIYASDRTVAHKIEPFVLDMIKEKIDSEEDVLFEGVHFNTPFARFLLDQFPGKVKVLYLGYKEMTVEDKVTELYTYKDNIDNPWIFNHQGEKVEDIVSYMIDESNRVYLECKNHNLPYYEVKDINLQMEEIIEILMK